MRGPGRRGAPMPPMSMKGQWGLLVRVMKMVMKNYALQFVLVLLCIATTTICTMQSSLFTEDLFNKYIPGIKEHMRLENADLSASVPADAETDGEAAAPIEPLTYTDLAIRLAQLVAVLSVGVACSYIQQRIMLVITQGSMLRLRNDLFTHMQSLPIKYFDTHSHGDVMSVYTNDVDTMRMLIGQSFIQVFNSVVTIVYAFVLMVTMSWQLTILSIVLIFLTMLISGKLIGLAGKHFSAQQQNLGKLNGYVEEMMSGQKVVKVFCHEDKSLEQFRQLNENLRSSAHEANRWANTMGPINNNLGHISYVIVAMVGAAIAIGTDNPITWLGTLVAFLQLNQRFSQPITQVAQQMNSIVMAMAGARRVFALLDEKPETDEGYVELVNAYENEDGQLVETDKRTGLWAWKHPHKADGTVTYRKVEGGVTFNDVDFGYTDEKQVLFNISMYAMPGQKIAFVGGTGAGKTTITNLINRFYDIQDGKIRYDDININKIRKADLRRSLGMVLQDTHLFTGTVLDNIRYGKLDATDEECIAAAKLANADGFIRRLPEGYNTMLTGDGSNLSQGQRQLLAIARAAVADPPCLILDEATSSIDTRTETLVQRGMDALMKGRTTFVIAHRLSTVKNSDCIMVLEQGRIIERGTHDDLIEQKGKYYQLYTGNAIQA
ncbi:MAG: ABC transporter ATP-binding protein [Clostridiales bacterium]|nr:ABC transporter ATP-binding protein [Clostridiales bacterium]